MQLKRKGPEEDPITDALPEGIPSKKLRQDFQFHTIAEQEPCPIIVEEGPMITEVCPVEVQITDAAAENPPALFITEPDSDERALVLYQPRSSSKSTFPFQYKVSDTVDWFSPSKSFRQNTALCYGSANNSLAVIPYVAPRGEDEPRGPYRGSVIIEEITDEDENNTESMMVEDSAPVPMDADVPEPMDISTTAATTVTAPQYTCDAPYWQRFNPPYTPVMWS